MPLPPISQVHINAPLTNISVAFLQAQENFVASSVFPRLPVTKKSDLYFVFPREYWLKNFTRKRAAGTIASVSGYTLTTNTYVTERDAVAHQIPDPIRENADSPLDLDRQATEWVSQQLLLAQEVDFAAKFFATSIWTGSSTGGDITPATTWDDVASTPVEDIRQQKRAILSNTGQEPNVLVCGKALFDRLCDNPDIVDRIKYGQTAGAPAVANEQTLAQVLGLDRVVVAKATNQTAAEGAAATYAFILGGRNALLAYAAPNPGVMQPSAGYKMVWGGAGNNMGVQIKRYRREEFESDWIEGGIWYQHNLVSAALGAFFSNAIAAAAA